MEESSQSIYMAVLADPGLLRMLLSGLDDEDLAEAAFPYWEMAISDNLRETKGEKNASAFLGANKEKKMTLWPGGHYYSFSYFLDLLYESRQRFAEQISRGSAKQE